MPCALTLLTDITLHADFTYFNSSIIKLKQIIAVQFYCSNKFVTDMFKVNYTFTPPQQSGNSITCRAVLRARHQTTLRRRPPHSRPARPEPSEMRPSKPRVPPGNQISSEHLLQLNEMGKLPIVRKPKSNPLGAHPSSLETHRVGESVSGVAAVRTHHGRAGDPPALPLAHLQASNKKK